MHERSSNFKIPDVVKTTLEYSSNMNIAVPGSYAIYDPEIRTPEGDVLSPDQVSEMMKGYFDEQGLPPGQMRGFEVDTLSELFDNAAEGEHAALKTLVTEFARIAVDNDFDPDRSRMAYCHINLATDGEDRDDAFWPHTDSNNNFMVDEDGLYMAESIVQERSERERPSIIKRLRFVYATEPGTIMHSGMGPDHGDFSDPYLESWGPDVQEVLSRRQAEPLTEEDHLEFNSHQVLPGKILVFDPMVASWHSAYDTPDRRTVMATVTQIED